MSDDELELTVGVEALPHQAALLLYDPEEDRGPTIEALLGWWGSAKSIAGALKMLRMILENPWTPKYRSLKPQAVIMAPSARIVERMLIPKMEYVVPPELIAKKWSRPYPRWLFANGVELSFVSGDAEFEGEDLFAVWIDEIHHSVFSNNPDRFTNFYSRLRDPNAVRLSMVCTGRPEAGWTRETFDLERLEPAQRVNRFTRLCGTDDNPYLPPKQLDVLLGFVPAGMENLVRKGGWMLPPGAVFSSYDQSVHIVPNARVEPRAPVHVGLDVGTHSAAVLGHDCPAQIRGITGEVKQGNGLLVIDDLAGVGLSVEDLVTQVKLRPAAHNIIPGKSKIYADPTIRRDEMNVIRKHFPGVHVVVRQRTDEFYAKAPGIRVMQAALRDGKGNTRIWFCKRLQGTRNGVLDAIVEAKTSPKTGEVVKDDRTDHALDALRYLVQGRLGSFGGFQPESVR